MNQEPLEEFIPESFTTPSPPARAAEPIAATRASSLTLWTGAALVCVAIVFLYLSNEAHWAAQSSRGPAAESHLGWWFIAWELSVLIGGLLAFNRGLSRGVVILCALCGPVGLLITFFLPSPAKAARLAAVDALRAEELRVQKEILEELRAARR